MLISREQWAALRDTLNPELKADRKRAKTLVIDEVKDVRTISDPSRSTLPPFPSYLREQYLRPVINCRWDGKWRFVIEHQWFDD